MLRELFERRFLQAAAQARDFARQFIEEPLPEAMCFRVHLNASYDANATSEHVLFPEDSALGATLLGKDLTEREVVELLWRDGLVPQWIDISVVSENGVTTRLELAACGRFVGDETRLYYTWTEVAPFGVKGPAFPVDHVEGRRFSLYDRASCATLRDLSHVVARADKVWSLDLHGESFDDEVLAALPTFARLEILELSGARISGDGLACVAKMPALRHLRVGLRDAATLRLGALPHHEALASLSLRARALSLRGVRRLPEAFPVLKELTLAAVDSIDLDASLAMSGMEKLSLDVPVLDAWAQAPESLVALTIRATRADDAQVSRMIDSCPAGLVSLSLRGTPVTPAVLDRVARFGGLEFLDVVDTRVTPSALERFAIDRPRLRFFPRARPPGNLGGEA